MKEKLTIALLKEAENGSMGSNEVYTMTRSEATERMAKAMCHSPFESYEGCIVQKKKQACKQALEGMKELAEAALNALLEDKK